jgi:hypothetical protein
MFVYEPIIAVVLQKGNAMLHDNSGNQAVNRISDRDALAPQFAVNRRSQLEGRPVIFQVNQRLKTPFGGDKFLFLADALQNFGQNKTTAAKVIAIPDALFQFFRLPGYPTVKEINQDR